MKTLPSVVTVLCVLGAAGGSCAAYSPDKTRPNILYIFADDQSYKTVGCYPEA